MLPSRCSNDLLCRKCLPWCWTAATTYKIANLVCALNPIIRANESDRTSFYLLHGETNAWPWSHFCKTQIQFQSDTMFLLPYQDFLFLLTQAKTLKCKCLVEESLKNQRGHWDLTRHCCRFLSECSLNSRRYGQSHFACQILKKRQWQRKCHLQK